MEVYSNRQQIPALYWLMMAGVLSWPSLYNRFPLVFSDTGTYIAAAIEGFVPIDRSFYYSLFLWAIGRFISLHAITVVQALIAVSVISIFLRVVFGSIKPWLLVSFVAILAVLTPLSWTASWLMPDVFGGVMILSVIVLGLYWEQLSLRERWGLLAIFVFANVVHTGNIFVSAAMIVLVVSSRWLAAREVSKGAVCALIAAFVSACVASIIPNFLFREQLSINPSAHVFLTARLIGDGHISRYLAVHCPREPQIILCPYQDELRGMTLSDFLWKRESLAKRTQAYDNNADLYKSLVIAVVIEQWPDLIIENFHNTFRLIWETSHMSALPAMLPRMAVNRVIQEHYPYIYGDYTRSRQQQATLPLEAFAGIHKWTTYSSYIFLLAGTIWAALSGRRKLAILGVLILVSLAINAGVHATASGVAPRFQTKVTWLATLGAMVAVLRCVSSIVARGNADRSVESRHPGW